MVKRPRKRGDQYNVRVILADLDHTGDRVPRFRVVFQALTGYDKIKALDLLGRYLQLWKGEKTVENGLNVVVLPEGCETSEEWRRKYAPNR